MSQIKTAIDFCRANNYSFFPINPVTKKPCVDWKVYQTRFPTDEEATKWMHDYPNMSIAIVTGRISNLIVVDLDRPDGVDESDDTWIEKIKSQVDLPHTFTVKSWGGGLHLYYIYSWIHEIRNSAGILDYVDIRGEGWCTISPGSLHESWNTYEVIDDNNYTKADCPEWVHEKQTKEREAGTSNKKIKGRNDKSTKWIGWILRKYPESEWDDAWDELVQFNLDNNDPALDESELRTVFESICKAENNKREWKTESQINRAMKIILDNGRFIRDQIWDAFFVCRHGESQKILSVESSLFKDWVQNKYHALHKSVLSPNLLKSIESLAKCRATDSKEVQQVDIRLQRDGDIILYDLADDLLSCVWLDGQWWHVSKLNPGFFRRWKNNIQQVEPVVWWDAQKIWEYINITDARSRILILSTLITRFIPDIQHPILMVHGPKWSAKSTFLEVIKRLIDPSSKWLLQLPWDSNGLIHTFLNDYLLCYDNISKISHETSDDLCRAVSGASLSKRKLHTDSDDIIYSFRKAICINGINLEANQPDLLQRSVILQLEAVQKRIPPSTFWRNFEKDLPSILWGIFDIIVRAISIEKTLLDDDWAFERLADFHKWGEAICQAIGNSPWLFSELLKENSDAHDEVALSSNIATSILLEFMKSRSYWEWTATELRNELYNLASSRSETRFLPATAHTLMNTLNRFKENLEHVGISIVSSKSWTRLVQISNKSCNIPYSKDPFST